MYARTRVFSTAGVGLCAATAALGFGGPDVFVCLLGGNSPESGFINYGAADGYRAYTVLTIACNQGDEPANWDDELPEPDNAHPVIAMNMFRLRNQRFEQIGMSWVKHGYAAGQVDWCTDCQPGGTQHLLGVGCCDVYGEVVNGNQFILAPRSEINAATGEFLYPFCSPAEGGLDCPPFAEVIGRRLQVKQTDLDTSPDVMYFYEVHYVLPDDAVLADPPTDDNNASHRRVSIDAHGDLAAWESDVVHYEPGIKGWKMHGLGPDTPDPGVYDAAMDIPGDGRFWLSAKATDLGKGVWHYEYALHNLNSDRSGQSFTVPLPPPPPPGAGEPIAVTNMGFHDIDYHSGEPYSLADWTATSSSSDVNWFTETYETNINANALRWGTLYNFRFGVNVPPGPGHITLGLFKPGEFPSVTVKTIVPQWPCAAADIAPPAGGGGGGGDGQIDVNDLLAIIGAWGPCPDPPTECRSRWQPRRRWTG
jgi:hypothetical protein